MGQRAAQMIIHRERGRESNEFYFSDRGSL